MIRMISRLRVDQNRIGVMGQIRIGGYKAPNIPEGAYESDRVQLCAQCLVLKENGYGDHGEYVGLDVKAMRTTKDADSYKHLENSMRIFRALEEKADRFDYDFQKKCVENRDFEALEMYVMDLLMGIN